VKPASEDPDRDQQHRDRREDRQPEPDRDRFTLVRVRIARRGGQDNSEERKRDGPPPADDEAGSDVNCADQGQQPEVARVASVEQLALEHPVDPECHQCDVAEPDGDRSWG
jgi:hypothetical protein